MRRITTGLLAATAMTSTPSFAATGQQAIRTAMGPILATAPDAETLSAKCGTITADIAARQAALEAQKGKATIANTLAEYDAIGALIDGAAGEFELYKQVMADEERREAGSACTVELSNLSSKLSLSRPIYERLKSIDASKADAETAFYLERTIGDFERSGVALDEAGRKRVQELNEKISAVGTQFETNIAEGRKVIKVKPDELEGLPADYREAHKPGEDGLVEISTDYPDYVPVMSYAESDALRRRLSEVYNQRAYPENDPLLKQLFSLRQELAEALGRPNYAALVLEDKMLDTPAKVDTLIAEMAEAARPAAQRDYAKSLAVLRTLQPGATEVKYWQTGWLSPKVKQKYYDYDPQEARQYFAYDNVRDGILTLTQDLFGIEIRPWDTPVWNEDVETYEMVDDGKVIGRFYFDSHPRPGKFSHANMIPLRPGVPGGEPPVGALVMNLPKGDHATGLMEHSDVETFLHEFGHMIHGMFGGTQRWFGQSGVATEWDFVEAPSQMLQNWVYDYDTLAKFAVDKDGNTIPRELVEKMNRARYFNLGFGDMVQLGYTNISLQFHKRPVPDDMGAAARSWFDEYAVIPMPDYVQMQDAFGHLNGYSATYYTYRWSKVIADDLFTRFDSAGLRDAATASAYRTMVLGKGGTMPAAGLVRDFLGRDVSLDAYKTELAKDQ